jgi:hypothetical protein
LQRDEELSPRFVSRSANSRAQGSGYLPRLWMKSVNDQERSKKARASLFASPLIFLFPLEIKIPPCPFSIERGRVILACPPYKKLSSKMNSRPSPPLLLNESRADLTPAPFLLAGSACPTQTGLFAGIELFKGVPLPTLSLA